MIQFDFSTIAFFVFAVLTLGGALGVVTNRNLFRGTIWLMVSLFGVAGLYALPPSWQQYVDPTSGHPYFVNLATGETTWARPV